MEILFAVIYGIGVAVVFIGQVQQAAIGRAFGWPGSSVLVCVVVAIGWPLVLLWDLGWLAVERTKRPNKESK